VFIGFRLGFAGGEFFSEKDEHTLGDEARSGKDFEEDAETAGAIAGLFEEFASGGAAGGFAGFHASGDEFPKKLSRGVAVLADEKNAAVGKKRQNDDGAGMDDDVACGADASRLDDAVTANGKDAAGEYGLAVEDACGGHNLSGDIIQDEENLPQRHRDHRDSERGQRNPERICHRGAESTEKAK
jgi:hypothetical protein